MWAIFDRLNKCCFDYIESEEGINMMRTHLKSYWRWKKWNLEFLYIEFDKSGSLHCWNEVSIWQILVRECESSSEERRLVELDISWILHNFKILILNEHFFHNFSSNIATRHLYYFSTFLISELFFNINQNQTDWS